MSSGSGHEDAAVAKTFEEMPLSSELLRGIVDHGFESPSLTQQQAIPPLISGRDLIVQATTGSGKDGALAVGILQRVDLSLRECQGLVICPTRELATSTCDLIASVGRHLSEAPFTFALVGDIPLERAFEDSAIVVGTTRVVNDSLRRREMGVALRSEHMKMVIFDEMGDTVGSGQLAHALSILEHLPADIQVSVFSDAMPPEVLLITQFMRDPVLVRRERLVYPYMQYYVVVEEEYKLETLLDLLDCVGSVKVVVFSRTFVKTEWLRRRLTEEGLTVSHITMDMGREERAHASSFHRGATQILVLPHVFITHVFGRSPFPALQPGVIVNYDTPSRGDLLYPIQATGADTKLLVTSFVTGPDEIRILQDASPVEELPLHFVSLLE